MVTDRLLMRGEWLDPPDRAIIEAIYREGITTAELARRLGADVRVLRRRRRRLVARMLCPLFAFVALNRDAWGPTRRRVATACVLQGRSLRQATRSLGLSLHTVRRHLAAVEAMCEGQRQL